MGRLAELECKETRFGTDEGKTREKEIDDQEVRSGQQIYLHCCDGDDVPTSTWISTA